MSTNAPTERGAFGSANASREELITESAVCREIKLLTTFDMRPSEYEFMRGITSQPRAFADVQPREIVPR